MLQISDLIPFHISVIQSLSSCEIADLASLRRPVYYEAVFITEGSCSCQIDLVAFTIESYQVAFIKPGQLNKYVFSAGATGYIISFTRDFLYLSLESSLLRSMDACFAYASYSRRSVDREIRPVVAELTEYMRMESLNRLPYKLEVIRGFLKVFLLYVCRNTSHQHPAVENNKLTRFVHAFFDLLEVKYATFTTATHYADALAVTTSYLNENIKRASGFTTSYHIKQRRLMEAKRLMISSHNTMKEVAYSVGFDDMSHFSKFFKNNSGLNYTDYKRQLTVVGAVE